MASASLRPLELVDADEERHRFDAMVATMAAVQVSVRLPGFALVAEIARCPGRVEGLGERMEALESELVPPHRSYPCCHRLSLAMVETRPHPEFGTEGIEEHQVRYSCGYEASRL